MGKERSMRRRMQRQDMPVKMVAIFLPLYRGLQTAAQDLKTDVTTLIHNTLAQGLSNWAKAKEKSSLIEVPEGSLWKQIAEEAQRGPHE